jgi:hypothetical protein
MWEGDAAGSDLRSANHSLVDLLRLRSPTIHLQSIYGHAYAAPHW